VRRASSHSPAEIARCAEHCVDSGKEEQGKGDSDMGWFKACFYNPLVGFSLALLGRMVMPLATDFAKSVNNGRIAAPTSSVFYASDFIQFIFFLAFCFGTNYRKAPLEPKTEALALSHDVEQGSDISTDPSKSSTSSEAESSSRVTNFAILVRDVVCSFWFYVPGQCVRAIPKAMSFASYNHMPGFLHQAIGSLRLPITVLLAWLLLGRRHSVQEVLTLAAISATLVGICLLSVESLGPTDDFVLGLLLRLPALFIGPLVDIVQLGIMIASGDDFRVIALKVALAKLVVSDFLMTLILPSIDVDEVSMWPWHQRGGSLQAWIQAAMHPTTLLLIAAKFYNTVTRLWVKRSCGPELKKVAQGSATPVLYLITTLGVEQVLPSPLQVVLTFVFSVSLVHYFLLKKKEDKEQDRVRLQARLDLVKGLWRKQLPILSQGTSIASAQKM